MHAIGWNSNTWDLVQVATNPTGVGVGVCNCNWTEPARHINGNCGGKDQLNSGMFHGTGSKMIIILTRTSRCLLWYVIHTNDLYQSFSIIANQKNWLCNDTTSETMNAFIQNKSWSCLHGENCRGHFLPAIWLCLWHGRKSSHRSYTYTAIWTFE